MENYNAVFIEKRGNYLVSVYFDDINSKHKREIGIDFDSFVPKGHILPGIPVNAEVSYFIEKNNKSQQGVEANKKSARVFLKDIISVIRSGGQLYVCSNECGSYICNLSRKVNTYEISELDVSVLSVSGLTKEKALCFGFDFNQLPHSAFCKAMCLQVNQFAGLEGPEKQENKKEESTSLFANLHLLDGGVYKLSKCFESRERAFEIAKRQTSYVKTVEIKM